MSRVGRRFVGVAAEGHGERQMKADGHPLEEFEIKATFCALHPTDHQPPDPNLTGEPILRPRAPITGSPDLRCEPCLLRAQPSFSLDRQGAPPATSHVR